MTLRMWIVLRSVLVAAAVDVAVAVDMSVVPGNLVGSALYSADQVGLLFKLPIAQYLSELEVALESE